MDNIQSNIQFGDVRVMAGEALTGLEGYLVMISNASGTPKAYLPDANTDLALYIVAEGAASGSYATLRPLAHAQRARVILNGTVAIGARVKLVTPDGTNDGKVDTIGSTGGVYFSPGIALETGADEQALLIQPDPQLVIVEGTAIDDPTGGTTTDAEARTAIGSIIDALEARTILAAAS